MTPLDRIREWLNDLPDDVQNDIASSFKDYHDRISGGPLKPPYRVPIESNSPDPWLAGTGRDDDKAVAWLHAWLTVEPEYRLATISRALTFRAATHYFMDTLTKRGWDKREDEATRLFQHAEDMAIRNRAEKDSWLRVAKLAGMHLDEIPKLRIVWGEAGKRWRELKKAHLDDGPLDRWRYGYDDPDEEAP